MNEKNIPQKHTNIVAVDQDPSVRDFLGLDKTPKAKSSYDELEAFTDDFEQAAGLVPDREQISHRAQKRGNESTGRRPLNVAQKALVGAGVVGGALTVGLIGGQDLQHEQDLAKYDEANKAANIAENPELYGRELPEDPRDMTVQVDSQAVTSYAPDQEAEPYVVGTDPGIDTPWEMASSIREKLNSTPGVEPIGDIRPIVDDIVGQSDGGLEVGEQIMVPKVADRHSDPGIQLSSK